jgi:hypothetical protein
LQKFTPDMLNDKATLVFLMAVYGKGQATDNA